MTPIELNNFSIHLGKRITLKKCNFSIAEGSSTVIMGPTGTGKSVFLKSIGGILSTQIFTFEGSMKITGTMVTSRPQLDFDAWTKEQSGPCLFPAERRKL